MSGSSTRMRTAPDLASERRLEAKRLRDWLRATYPRAADLHGCRWYLTDEAQSQRYRRSLRRDPPRTSSARSTSLLP
jgi:hypothetical protein